MKKKVVALIPTRLESKRLPGKALADICGLPMIVHTCKRAMLSEVLDDIYVATQTGDRLDLLANQYYGSPAYWWIIANANNIHDGKLGLKDGTILRIPANHMEIIRKETNE